MKKYLLPKDGNFYKANLHMHTTISDGKMTTDEVKEAYMKKGYSIVAFTDHEVMVPHPELSDNNFLAITSTEISVNEHYDTDFHVTKTYHLNLYSKEPLKNCFNTFTESVMWLEHSKKYISPLQREMNYQRYYHCDSINEIIQMAKEEGCLVSYNHPVWSLQDLSDYKDLKGLWGVEWYNTGCAIEGFLDTIDPIDQLLKRGENVFPLATDDAHNLGHCFGGFVMVKANNLKYETIYAALEKGDFYSSTKPTIDELYIDDGIINIKTSPVKSIVITTDRRYSRCLYGDDITVGSFDINDFLRNCISNPGLNPYIRITLVDCEGNVAHTRAYRYDELVVDGGLTNE